MKERCFIGVEVALMLRSALVGPFPVAGYPRTEGVTHIAPEVSAAPAGATPREHGLDGRHHLGPAVRALLVVPQRVEEAEDLAGLEVVVVLDGRRLAVGRGPAGRARRVPGGVLLDVGA